MATLELAARVVGVDAGEQRGRELDLLLGRTGWASSSAAVPCSRAVGDRRVEVRRRRSAPARASASAIPMWRMREQPRGVAAGPLRRSARRPAPAAPSPCRPRRAPAGRSSTSAEAAGSSARQPTPPATSSAAGRGAGLGVAADPDADRAATGRTLTATRGGERVDAPTGDEQEHDQEDHRGQRRREQRQRHRGAERKGEPLATSVPARRGLRVPGVTSRAAGRPDRRAGPAAPGRGRSRASRTPPSARRRARARRRRRTPTRRPRAGGPARRRRRPAGRSAPTSAAAPPSACTARMTSSGSSEFEAPQASEASANSTNPPAARPGAPTLRASERRGGRQRHREHAV